MYGYSIEWKKIGNGEGKLLMKNIFMEKTAKGTSPGAKSSDFVVFCVDVGSCSDGYGRI